MKGAILGDIIGSRFEFSKLRNNKSEDFKLFHKDCVIAGCVYLARMKTPKKIIKEFIETFFNYNLNRSIENIRPNYYFDETCQGSVPESIVCFLEGSSYEDVIRKAVSLGGDTDTQACIAGGIAEAYYGISDKHIVKINDYLDNNMLNIINQFDKRVK